MAETIKGQQCVWGTTPAGADSGGGIVVDASVNTTAQTDPVEDQQGAEVGLVIYDEQWEISVEVVCRAGTQKPAIGANWRCGGLSGYVTGVRENWRNKGKKSLAITAHGAKGL